MTTLTGIAGGTGGYLGVATESIPGTTPFGTPGLWLPPTDFIPTEAKNFPSDPDVFKPPVFLGSRAAMPVMRNGKFKTTGVFNSPLFCNVGMLMLPAGLGGATYLPAVASDTAISITTVGNISTIVLTGGTGAYTQNAWFLADTGASQECKRILSWTPGTKSLTCVALSKTHTGTPAIVQPAQNKISPLFAAGGYSNQLRTVSAEDNVGDLYSYQYANGLISKQVLKGSKDKIDIAHDLSFSALPLPSATPTALVKPSDLELRTPYNFNDCYVLVSADPSATGASSFQRILIAEDWTVTLTNKLAEYALADNTQSYRFFPSGGREVAIEYSILQTSNRQAGYEDLVKPGVETPFFVDNAQNVGTLANPIWQAFGITCPSVHIEKSAKVDGLDKSIGEKLSGQARDISSTLGEMSYFILNNAVAAIQ